MTDASDRIREHRDLSHWYSIIYTRDGQVSGAQVLAQFFYSGDPSIADTFKDMTDYVLFSSCTTSGCSTPRAVQGSSLVDTETDTGLIPRP